MGDTRGHTLVIHELFESDHFLLIRITVLEHHS